MASKSNISSSLLNNVRDLCKNRGLKMKDIAMKVGMAPQSLSNALRGNPTLSTLSDIAGALNVPVSRLLLDGSEKDYFLLAFFDKK